MSKAFIKMNNNTFICPGDVVLINEEHKGTVLFVRDDSLVVYTKSRRRIINLEDIQTIQRF